MGATYLSMQCRTSNRDAVVAELRAIASTGPAPAAFATPMPLQFYVGEPENGWLPVFPNFTPELERSAKTLCAKADCLVVMFLSADEDDLYCMFFRHGKQLPWFKVAAGKKRTGKERDKLAAKVEALSEVCDAGARARLVTVLADSAGVTFSSDLLRAVSDILGMHSVFSSFEYLQRGERDGLFPMVEPELVSG